MILVSLASLALGAALATNTPVPAGAASAAAAVPTTVHAAPAQPRHNAEMISGRSNQSSDEDAIQQQIQLRVMFPALAGDA